MLLGPEEREREKKSAWFPSLSGAAMPLSSVEPYPPGLVPLRLGCSGTQNNEQKLSACPHHISIRLLSEWALGMTSLLLMKSSPISFPGSLKLQPIGLVQWALLGF